MGALADYLPETLESVRTQPLFVMKLDIRPHIIVGPTPGGYRRPVRGPALVYGPVDVMQRTAKGEAVGASSYYFRLQPLFETSATKYDWINRVVAIGAGQRRADGPVYNIFEVL